MENDESLSLPKSENSKRARRSKRSTPQPPTSPEDEDQIQSEPRFRVG